MLHDIDQPYNNKQNHVELSAKKATELLRSAGYSDEDIYKVEIVISEHSSEKISNFTSMESKILFDADKLDGLGASGIARVFMLMGANDKSIDESIQWYKMKIATASPNLQTEAGKRLFLERIEYAEKFFDYVESENNISLDEVVKDFLPTVLKIYKHKNQQTRK